MVMKNGINPVVLMELQECEQLLIRHGVKPTANRVVILRTLAAGSRPMSMRELEMEIFSIDKSNIFRALALFRARHLVHVIEDGDGGTRYELCYSHDEDNDEDEHMHFFCERCHRTYCLPDLHAPEVSLPEGYRLHSVNCLIKGVCPTCGRKGR